MPDTAVSDEVDAGVTFVGRPVLLKTEQEARQVSWKAMPVEVFDGEREAVVNADDGRGIRRKFATKPFGDNPPRRVPAWARRRLNLCRLVGTLGHVHPQSLATGVCGFRAGMVDAYVT